MAILQILQRPTDQPDDPAAPPAPSEPPGSPDPIEPLLPVVGADLDVPLVTGDSTTYANLDYAASAPCLAEVAARLSTVLPYYANVHRGAGYNSRVSTSLYEASRRDVGAFVDTRADDVVVFTRNTTDALNLLARCVPAGGEVICLDIEHHANLLPWQRRATRIVPAGTTLRGTLVTLRAELEVRPAALLTITGASNVTGEVLPLAEIVEIAHAAGARVAVDAAQLAPHRRISLARTGVDYLAFSGHKLYAPFGAGVLVGRRDWLDRAPAYLAGGGAVRNVELERTEWCESPQRHEGGTPNILGAAALAQACRVIGDLDAEALARHEDALRRRLVSGLSTLPGVELPRIWRDSDDAVGVVAFTVAGYEPGFVAAYLSAEHGIGVRDGKFCAHPLLNRLGSPDGAVRASFGAGTTSDDVDRLIRALTRLLRIGPSWTYAVVDGRWSPVPDPREVPSWAGETDPVGELPCGTDGTRHRA